MWKVVCIGTIVDIKIAFECTTTETIRRVAEENALPRAIIRWIITNNWTGLSLRCGIAAWWKNACQRDAHGADYSSLYFGVTGLFRLLNKNGVLSIGYTEGFRIEANTARTVVFTIRYKFRNVVDMIVRVSHVKYDEEVKYLGQETSLAKSPTKEMLAGESDLLAVHRRNELGLQTRADDVRIQSLKTVYGMLDSVQALFLRYICAVRRNTPIATIRAVLDVPSIANWGCIDDNIVQVQL